jgi:hypothetical protein
MAFSPPAVEHAAIVPRGQKTWLKNRKARLCAKHQPTAPLAASRTLAFTMHYNLIHRASMTHP